MRHYEIRDTGAVPGGQAIYLVDAAELYPTGEYLVTVLLPGDLELLGKAVDAARGKVTR